MIKKVFAIFLALGLQWSVLRAEEGMWLPMLISQNIEAMQKMGLQLTAEDLYSVNQTSLKDGIVWFGGGCTGVIVSEEGLILTNHHCGYGQIQSHSTVENDYLTDGFWASSKDKELPNPTLRVSILRRMDDVSEAVLKGVNGQMTEKQRADLIQANIRAIEKEASENGKFEARVRPMYFGAEYYLFVNEVFRDVRLVGAPPSAIGKFGGDTDNWMWPRHTGDFSVFRIYANTDNEAAAYSASNVPYKPKHYFPVSVKPLNEGDFTFVYGFPGRTNQYLTSHAVKQITEMENPVAIKLRTKRLDVIGNEMGKQAAVRIQYSAKHAGIANGWKKWIGENRGLARLNAIEVKQRLERDFVKWANSDEALKARYAGLMPAFEKIYEERFAYSKASKYFFESARAVEIMNFAQRFSDLINQSKKNEKTAEELQQMAQRLLPAAEAFYKDYYQPIDREIFGIVIPEYFRNVEKRFHPATFAMVEKKYKGDFSAYANMLFSRSMFMAPEKVYAFLKNYKPADFKKMESDPVFALAEDFRNVFVNSINSSLAVYDAQLDSLYRLYVEGLRIMDAEKRFFPDANSTLRITYGKVEGSTPRDAVIYYHQTLADGILEKAAEVETYEDYAIPAHLERLLKNKDYGRYAVNNTLPVAFLASNHTTGGNSGSPVINGKGELIGLNFDRSWESTMSDIMFDPSQCRNISVDMRYVLWVIEKYAGAKHLVDEIKIME